MKGKKTHETGAKYKKELNHRMKTRFQAIGCIAASLVLYGILTCLPQADSPVEPDGTILRDGYGGEDRRYELYVDGVLEEPFPLTVEVGARRYTSEEARQVFQVIMDGMEERIRGENVSLSEVRTSLILPTWLEEYGVRLRWSSSEPEILDSSGKIREGAVEAGIAEAGTTEAEAVGKGAAKAANGRTVLLSVQLTAEGYREEYELPVRILPPNRSRQQVLTDGLAREIRRREEAGITEEALTLPGEYEGKALRYRSAEESGYGVILLLGVILAALCYGKEQADEREREKNRERELLLDYPELLSKLMVLMGAGLTVRGAWERMVKDYEEAVRLGRQRRRAAYEEMGQTWHQLQNGMAEGTAYREFGKRCRLQPYLKLSSLLEQNRRTGSKNIRAILQTEMADAFEQRKNLARRLGEEAGTKLLLPLFMMLGIVMVMIMVPAMMTMG